MSVTRKQSWNSEKHDDEDLVGATWSEICRSAGSSRVWSVAEVSHWLDGRMDVQRNGINRSSTVVTKLLPRAFSNNCKGWKQLEIHGSNHETQNDSREIAREKQAAGTFRAGGKVDSGGLVKDKINDDTSNAGFMEERWCWRDENGNRLGRWRKKTSEGH